MTGSSVGQPHQCRKGLHCRWQHCSLDANKGLEIELCDFEAENVTPKGDYSRQVVEIVIGGVPTVLEISVMSWFVSLGRVLLQGSISTILFEPVRHQVDLRKVEVAI